MNGSLFGNYEYIFEKEKDLKKAAKNALDKYADGRTPVRAVFFGNPRNNREYREGLDILKEAVAARWGGKSPVVTYVAQPLTDGNSLAVEVHSIEPGSGDAIHYRQYDDTPYVVIAGSWGKKVVAGGIQGCDLDADMKSQSDEVFDKIGGILKAEGLGPGNIIRQWNYLERITDFDGDVQRYQAFNDSRSDFYAGGLWEAGYPAATGIGTQWGGVTVEFDAMQFAGGIGVRSIDNALQIAAHDYSDRVLLGEGERSTPKFERAKALWDSGEGMVYVSGTAAIRGENSLTDSDITEQTLTTLENIDFLTGEANLEHYGVTLKGGRKYRCFRVYLKEPGFYAAAKAVVDRSHGDVPALYVWADICRCELLVEIEGISSINY